MGKNNRTRRAAKAKTRARRRAGQHGAKAGRVFSAPPDPSFDVDDLATHLWLMCSGGAKDLGLDPETATAARHRLSGLPAAAVDQAASRLILDAISRLWSDGWQPAELCRQARLATGSTNAERLVGLAVEVDHARHSHQAIDPRWTAQIEAGRPATELRADWLTRLRTRAGLPLTDAHDAISAVITMLFSLPALAVLIPPPGATSADPTTGASAADRMLRKVRALLAKAESSEYEAEASALTAKAQELITRYAIDRALVDQPADGAEPPAMIRVPVDPPYADAKSLLLQHIAQESRCRTVFHPSLLLTTVVGMPSDMTAVEVLFTSLLVQAQHALSETSRTAPPGTRTRSQSYRSAFWVAYSQRIGVRLREINEHVFSDVEAESSRFLPVLAAQSAAIDDAVRDTFGELVGSSVRGGWDGVGGAHGRQAADRAQLNFGDLEDGRAA